MPTIIASSSKNWRIVPVFWPRKFRRSPSKRRLQDPKISGVYETVGCELRMELKRITPTTATCSKHLVICESEKKNCLAVPFSCIAGLIIPLRGSLTFIMSMVCKSNRAMAAMTSTCQPLVAWSHLGWSWFLLQIKTPSRWGATKSQKKWPSKVSNAMFFPAVSSCGWAVHSPMHRPTSGNSPELASPLLWLAWRRLNAKGKINCPIDRSWFCDRPGCFALIQTLRPWGVTADRDERSRFGIFPPSWPHHGWGIQQVSWLKRYIEMYTNRQREREVCVCVCACMCIHIYIYIIIYIYTHTHTFIANINTCRKYTLW